MAKVNQNAVHSTIDAAKDALAATAGKRRRTVYRASLADQSCFVVATSANKARSYAARHFGLSVEVAEPSPRTPPVRKSLEERLAEMGTDELTRIREAVERRMSGAEQPPAKKRTKK